MSNFTDLLKRSVRWRYRLIPLPLAYGREFREWMAFLERSSRFSEDELQAYTWARVKALIEFAYNNTQYYGESLSSVGCEPGDIKSPRDYAKLPLTNRKIVRENLERMTPRGFEKTRPITTITSGTTGFPLKLYRSTSQEQLRKAIVWRHYLDLGYRFKQRRITLGRPLDFPDKKRYVVQDIMENNLQLNSFHLNPREFIRLYQPAAEFGAKMIVGQPSALYAFCLQSTKLGLDPIRVPVVYSYSEKLYPHHVEKFREFFGGEVFDYLGNRENTFAVTQNSCGGMHINSEFGMVEFMTEDRRSEIGELGSVVTTSLENYSIPLLRYDTGDMGRPTGRCPNCNRTHPTMEILGGRGKDVLVTKDGFTNCQLNTYLTRQGFTGVDWVQVVQKAIDAVTIRILPNDEYRGTEDDSLLEKLALESMGGYFRITIEHLTEPPFTEAGKMPYVVSELTPTSERPEKS